MWTASVWEKKKTGPCNYYWNLFTWQICAIFERKFELKSGTQDRHCCVSVLLNSQSISNAHVQSTNTLNEIKTLKRWGERVFYDGSDPCVLQSIWWWRFFFAAFGYRYFRHNCTYFKKYRSEDSTQSHCLTVRRLIIYIVQEPAMNERTNEHKHNAYSAWRVKHPISVGVRKLCL